MSEWMAKAWRAGRCRAAGLLVMMAGVLAAAAATTTTARAAMDVVDDRGVSVSLASPPRRIVTLLPSLTETVCELGRCTALVGTDRYSNHPAPVQALPKTGGLDDANVELIVSLKPDLVLLGISSRVTERLEALGLKVIALEPRTYEDVRRVAGKVAQALGRPGAGEALWQRLDAQVAEAARSVPAGARGLTVYYEVDSAPYAAGASSFIGHTLARLGAVNIVPNELGPFPKLNPEFVVRADPQVIMASRKSRESLPARPGWARIRAIRDGRLCTFGPEQMDVLSRPGPRMGEAARLLARCLKDAAAVRGSASVGQ